MLGGPHRIEAALLHCDRQLRRGDRVIREKDRGAEFHEALPNRSSPPMLGCVARPGNLGVSTAPAKEGVFEMQSIASAWQLPPAHTYDLAGSPQR